MALPQGTQQVTYGVSMSDSSTGTDVSINFTIWAEANIGGEATDATLQAGAEAMIVYLETEYPNAIVNAQRTYTGQIPGDPWPVA